LESEQKKKKRKYEKPKLRTIDLAVQEVLGVGCKLETGGPMAVGATPCATASCLEIGT